MNSDQAGNKGGFHIGSVGRDVSIRAGGDVVAGDKATTTTIQRGFAGDEQKREFQEQIGQVREALRALKAEIESRSSLSADEKDEVVAEVLQQVTALKALNDQAADAPAGRSAPRDFATAVENTLTRADGMVERLQGLARKSVDVAEVVGCFAAKYGPMLATARHLFGLP